MGDKVMKHAEYQKRIEKLPSVALIFIIKDAKEAVAAMPDGPNAGYYADEVCYCADEMHKRSKKLVNREQQYKTVLQDIFLILKEAGYDSNDMVDDLRDLVNDSQRPATEADEAVNSMAAKSKLRLEQEPVKGQWVGFCNPPQVCDTCPEKTTCGQGMLS